MMGCRSNADADCLSHDAMDGFHNGCLDNGECEPIDEAALMQEATEKMEELQRKHHA